MHHREHHRRMQIIGIGLVLCLIGAGQAQGLVVCIDACGHMAVELYCSEDASHSVSDTSLQAGAHAPGDNACGACVDFDPIPTLRQPDTRPKLGPVSLATIVWASNAFVATAADPVMCSSVPVSQPSTPLGSVLRI